MKKSILILVMLLCFSGSAFAKKSIVVAVPATVPPMAFVGEDGQLTGYSVEYIKAVAAAADFEVVLKKMAWSGIFVGLVKGEYDAICGAVSITEKRKKHAAFTEPYFELWHALAVRKDSPVTNLEDLKGERVGGKFGSIEYQALTEVDGLVAVGYPEVSSLLKALKEGEIEAIVYAEPMVDYYIEKKYKDSLNIVAILHEKEVDRLGIAVTKGNSEVLDLLNRGIASLKGTVTEKELHKKWLSSREK